MPRYLSSKFLLVVLLLAVLKVEVSSVESIINNMAEVADSIPQCIAVPNPLKLCIMVEPSPFTYVSGYANRFQELLRHLKASKEQVEIVTTEVNVKAKDRPSESFGFPIHYTRGVRLPLYNQISLSLDWTLQTFRTVFRLRPHLIHASSPGCMVFPALICSRLFSRPIVLSYHTHLPVYLQSYLPWLPTRWVWKLIRIVHSFADLTLVTSPQLEQEFHSHGIPRVRVWQKGIDAKRFHPFHSCKKMRRRMTGGKPTDFLIVYVGRLATEKRVHDLEGILEHLPGARLCLVGAGPQEAQLKEALPEAVFLGELQGKELSQAFASADVFLFPSDSETLGFVVMEAMASGLAVVAANAGGIPSMIHHRTTGWLVEPGNKAEYIYILQRLQANSAWRIQLAIRARKATEDWTWEASMANLRNTLYGQAILNYEDRQSVRMWRALFNRKNTGGLKTG